MARNLGHRGVVVFSILSLTIAFISSALFGSIFILRRSSMVRFILDLGLK
jgi:hypothetical protein